MERLEVGGFGRLDPLNFGLWLNADSILLSPLGAKLHGATLRSFHYGLDEGHREYVDSLTGADLVFAIQCLTSFTHERRHYHDVLATPYGSMLMRQYTRAAISASLYATEIPFGYESIAVPLADWVTNPDLFEAAYNIERPTARLQHLHHILTVMQEKLRAFDHSVADLPEQFSGASATSILEGLAIIAQEEEVKQHFGAHRVNAFRVAFRDPPVNRRYYSAIKMCYGILDRDIPTECLSYCLLASLCGKFQEPNLDIPRYPASLLVRLLFSLREAGARTSDDFDRLRAHVDDFFEQLYGTNAQGMVISAIEGNGLASTSLLEWIEKIERDHGLSPASPTRKAVRLLDNFSEVQAAFGARVFQTPERYVGAAYYSRISELPPPVVFIECRIGLPMYKGFVELYEVHAQRGILATSVPEYAEFGDLFIGEDKIMRVAFVFSPRRTPPGKTTDDAGNSDPQIDVDLWYELTRMLGMFARFLIEGPENMVDAVVQNVLIEYALVGVKVYSISGELQAPPIPDPDDLTADPALRRKLADPDYRNWCAAVRAAKAEFGAETQLADTRNPST